MTGETVLMYNCSGPEWAKLRQIFLMLRVRIRQVAPEQYGLTLEELASVIAAPFWSTIARRSPAEAEQLTYLRKIYASLLITGPFSIVLGFTGGLMALNDRLKLRSLITSTCGDRVYIASEEAAIRAMEPHAGHFYAPMGGEPMIVKVEEGAY